jgi:hypothetical protein
MFWHFVWTLVHQLVLQNQTQAWIPSYFPDLHVPVSHRIWLYFVFSLQSGNNGKSQSILASCFAEMYFFQAVCLSVHKSVFNHKFHYTLFKLNAQYNHKNIASSYAVAKQHNTQNWQLDCREVKPVIWQTCCWLEFRMVLSVKPPSCAKYTSDNILLYCDDEAFSVRWCFEQWHILIQRSGLPVGYTMPCKYQSTRPGLQIRIYHQVSSYIRMTLHLHKKTSAYGQVNSPLNIPALKFCKMNLFIKDGGQP